MTLKQFVKHNNSFPEDVRAVEVSKLWRSLHPSQQISIFRESETAEDKRKIEILMILEWLEYKRGIVENEFFNLADKQEN